MDPTAIREQIDRIRRSQTFANKTQLRKLLEVLSKNIDSQETLKPAQVIKELWPSETRTKRAADVATEVNRLRHALESYYDDEGKADPISIILPNRSVVAGDGLQQKRWIVAQPREDKEGGATAEQAPDLQQAGPKSESQASPRVSLKSFAAIAALCAALSIVGYFWFRALVIPDQPKAGRLDGSALVIMNAEGKELWRKIFPNGFGPDNYYAQDVASRIWFADLEGKGHTSVLFSYLPAASSQPHSSTLICYSDRGKEKWRWIPGRDLPEVPERPSTYKTFALAVLKATDRTPPRIVVVNNHYPWYGGPSQIAVIDSRGKTLSEYWHSGGLRDMVVADLDGDGREEIIATGIAHGYDAEATIVVLNPDRVFGASKEVQPQFQIHSMGEARERARLLFARSDLNRASFQFNSAIEPAVRNGNLQLTVQECSAPYGCPISYAFDRSLQLVAAHPGNDEFRSAHDRDYQNGKDAHTLGAEERAAFLKVRCLVGCKSEFVPVAETYSPSSSFETGWTGHSNPNGVWSYGYSAGFTNAITLYDKTVQNGVNGPHAKYWVSSSANTGTSPAAEYNDGPRFNDGNVDLLENEFVLVSGIQGQYSDLIFTTPADGQYSIEGNFRGAQYGVGTVVGIVANGTVVFRSSITSVNQLAPFRMTVKLQAGGRVVFSVGPGSGSQNTGLAATITRPCGAADKPSSTPSWEIMCSDGQVMNKGIQ